MPTIIGVAKESIPGEHRVALVPDVAKRFRALGVDILIEKGAGENSAYPDSDFSDVRWTENADDIWTQSDVILCVHPPSLPQVESMKPGAILIGFLHPFENPAFVRKLAESNITSFAVELVPRNSRAQSMDALSSQAAVSGYLCAVIAAAHCPKFFPMLTYAAGTVRPARVLVIGAGVAGLQAIATARRLGAVVEAYDVRPETREQIESLGAKFVDTGVAATGQGGYARELSEDEKRQQAERLGKVVAQCDALITTAAIPGRQAPRIINAGMVAAMTPLPVLGVPVVSKTLSGQDSLYSIVQMPPGVPVGTLAIGEAGAANAGLLAAGILALNDAALAARLDAWRARQTAAVAETPKDD